MAVTTEVLEWGHERARAGPWRGDGRVAYLAPLPGEATPSPDFLRRCIDQLAGQGYADVITSALAGPEQEPFLAVGFLHHERLRVLTHDLSDVDGRAPNGPHRLRRAVATDYSSVLDIDAGSFDSFWRLDEAGLREALEATPTARFRVAVTYGKNRQGSVVGYAITGRAADKGYLQRLAVASVMRRSGLGRTLALDSLRWLRRRGCRQALVNTQMGNDPALALYVDVGFRLQPSHLAVLHRSLAS